jgi:transposase
MAGLAERVDELRRLAKTDPDPRARRCAQAVLMLAQGASVVGVARWFRTAPHRVRAWRAWFLEGGRGRLADDSRCGRPPKLGADDLAFLDAALQRGPEATGWPVTVWSLRDLRELLRHQRRVTVSVVTVHRAVWGLGSRYRRPRHDLRHRQDAAAVDSTRAARAALAWLGKELAPCGRQCRGPRAEAGGTEHHQVLGTQPVTGARPPRGSRQHRHHGPANRAVAVTPQ